jgi:hypothetical protein
MGLVTGGCPHGSTFHRTDKARSATSTTSCDNTQKFIVGSTWNITLLENKQQGQRGFFSPRVSTASRMGLRKNSKPLTGITACCSLRNKTASRQRAEPCCTFRRAPCAHRKEAREGVVLGRRQGCCSWERGSAQGCCFWIKELGIGKNRPWQE